MNENQNSKCFTLSTFIKFNHYHTIIDNKITEVHNASINIHHIKRINIHHNASMFSIGSSFTVYLLISKYFNKSE
jgi:molybdopterin synthase catalytic subunit